MAEEISAAPQKTDPAPCLSAPEEPQVEFHKPKPVHNWHELLTEIGVVVIGVCIALAAEQTVEWLHWRAKVQEAREVIATETAQNIAGAILRIRTVQCGERRLDALARILDQAAHSGSLPPVGYIGQPPRFMWRSGAWDSVVASQTATHFPRDQLANLPGLYKIIQRSETYYNMEFEAWSDLYAMVGPGRRLDPGSEAELRKALGRARNTNRSMAVVATFLVSQAQAIDLPFSQADFGAISAAEKRSLAGEKPTVRDVANMSGICDPIGPVPPDYGEAQIQASATLTEGFSKALHDFGQNSH